MPTSFNYIGYISLFANSPNLREIKLSRGSIWSFINNPMLIDNNRGHFKRRLLTFLKVIRLLIVAVFFIFGLIGCIQQLAQPELNTLKFVFPGASVEGFSQFFKSGSEMVFSSENWNQYGPYMAVFVYPFAQMTISLMWAMRGIQTAGINALISIFILVFLIRLLTFAFSFRGIITQEKMTEHAPKIAEIKAKYARVKDNESKQKMHLEIRDYYKKNGIKFSEQYEHILLTLPIFLIIFRVVTIMKPFDNLYLFNFWNLSRSSLSEIFVNFASNGWKYLIFLLIMIPVHIFSQKIPQILASKRKQNKALSEEGIKQMRRNKIISNIVILITSILSATLATGVGVYYFINAFLVIIQSIAIHKYILHKRQDQKQQFKLKLEKFGIN